MVFCVGLTGGLASGKSTATDFFAKLGAVVIDADDSSRRLTAADGIALPALREVLGPWAFDEQGHLRRRETRQRIFADPALRQEMEAVLHPLIRDDLRQQMRDASNAPYLILSAPLLLETAMFADDYHRLVIVDCPPETQIARACRRDDLSATAARALLAAQWSRAARLARADDIIDNSGNINHLQQQVECCHRRYLSMTHPERNK